MEGYNPDEPPKIESEHIVHIEVSKDLDTISRDLNVYKSELKKGINEIILKPFDDDIRNLETAFVPLLCDIFVEQYVVCNKQITDITIAGESCIFPEIEDEYKAKVINYIENQINEGKDELFPDPSKRPIILSLPFSNGLKKARWYIDVISITSLLNKFILVGKPGSGKTISARYFALEFLKRNDLPIYIELKDFFEKNQTIDREKICLYIDNKYNTDSFSIVLKSFEENGKKIIFILDGIDEIYSDGIPAKILDERVSCFINNEKNAILTCREGYSEIKKFSILTMVNLRTLQDKQVEELFKKYSNTDPSEFKTYVSFMPQELKNRPLFIVLLVALFEKNREYPKDKVSLYEQCLDLLIFNWKNDSKKIDKKVYDYLIKEKYSLLCALEDIAYDILLKGALSQKNIIHTFIENEIRDYTFKIIDYLHINIGLLTRENDKFEFVHRSFCEYLAAKKIERSLDHMEIEELIELKTDLFKEPLLFLGDILRHNKKLAVLRDLLASLAEKKVIKKPNWSLWLATQLYHENDFSNAAKIYKKGLRIAINDYLLSKSYFPAKEQAEIVKTLGQIGDDRKGIGLNEDNLPDIEWCIIPEGKFNFGISEINKEFLLNFNITNVNRDLPCQEKFLPKFSISKYPITVCQFRSFINDDGYKNDKWWKINDESLDWFEKNKDNCYEETQSKHVGLPDNYPAIYISWFEANAFCKWLSSEMKISIVLPTEEQWEKAAKLNGDNIFPWGNDFEENLINSSRSMINDVCSVGSFSENINGPLDICGNIWEWTSTKEINQDDHKYYNIITRGGSFLNEPYKIIRTTFRGRDIPQAKFKRQGFRVIKIDAFEFQERKSKDIEIHKNSLPLVYSSISSLLPVNVKLISEKNNNGRKIESGCLVSLKYSLAYSKDDLDKEKYIQYNDKFELIIDEQALNPLVYKILTCMRETSTVVVSINAREFCDNFSFNNLIDLNKILFFEFHIISINQ